MWGLLVKIALVLLLVYCVIWPLIFGGYNAVRAYYSWMRP